MKFQCYTWGKGMKWRLIQLTYIMNQNITIHKFMTKFAVKTMYGAHTLLNERTSNTQYILGRLSTSELKRHISLFWMILVSIVIINYKQSVNPNWRFRQKCYETSNNKVISAMNVSSTLNCRAFFSFALARSCSTCFTYFFLFFFLFFVVVFLR